MRDGFGCGKKKSVRPCSDFVCCCFVEKKRGVSPAQFEGGIWVILLKIAPKRVPFPDETKIKLKHESF